MRVLVTGGCGFIGRHVVKRLLQDPSREVVNLDALTYAADPSAFAELDGDDRYQFIHGDICDSSAVRSAIEGCDAVMHLAAETFVDRSLHRASEFVKTNVLGTQELLAAAREAGVRRFVHISTDEVYGSITAGRATEDSPLAPTSPYSASKAGSDLLALAAYHSYGQDVVVTRCTNNYGPHQFLEKLIPLAVTNFLDGVAVPVYGDGEQVRDWLYVEDHAEALVLLLDEGKAGEIYNIGAEQDPEWSNLQIVKTLADLTARGEDLIEFVEDRPGHDRRYAVSSSKVRSIGWQPKHDLASGLAETVGWYESNRDWWEERIPEQRSLPAHKLAASGT
ncbi:MAG: dTDP-glucose 4,6-dehydratase [Acidobacteria bacterium]|nr:MAG: dTDP-glucose 4,6-dehydratase [Acidobacteriota bacterium]